MSITTKIAEFGEILPPGVTLVAVSKTHPLPCLNEAYDAGQRIFGESRPQEMLAKFSAMPADTRWHMIGHLQTNKVRSIAPFVELIHSVDSARLLDVINREASLAERTIDVLLELHIAREESKSGWLQQELLTYLDTAPTLPRIRFRGVMGIASLTDDTALIHREFTQLRTLFEEIRHGMGTDFDTLSMGMSNDWRIALECGSTMLRLGSTIFGDRPIV